jgi:hypothetical protein
MGVKYVIYIKDPWESSLSVCAGSLDGYFWDFMLLSHGSVVASPCNSTSLFLHPATSGRKPWVWLNTLFPTSNLGCLHISCPHEW